MRRQFIVFFTGLFWLVFSPASAAERGALFMVTAHGHTLHLFGTMHVGVAGFYPLEPRIMAALAAASTLALEIDPVQPQQALMDAMRRHGRLAPGAEGYERLAPSDRSRLERLVRQSGIEAANAVSLKPVLLATLLSMAEYTRLGYRPELSSDAYLALRARCGRTRVVELESVGAQLALLDQLPVDDQWRFLEETVATIESGAQRDQAGVMTDAWRDANQAALDGLAEAIANDRSVSGTFAREVMLDGRNAALADKLAQLLENEENTVAGIGVLHLLGRNSVPALLRARGIGVERVY
jgi:uncharacterized protein YbaP (TraB family)